MRTKFQFTILTLLTLTFASSLYANESKELFKKRCMACHTTQAVEDKNKLLGPPADEIMVHVKEAYKDRDEAISFMVDYILKPEVNKALCASMDKFGLMPAMKGVITKEQARDISLMMYEKFPRASFQQKEKTARSEVTFEMIDSDGDGFISSQEFRNFRAERNGIDPNSFKVDLYFKKVDLNGDGKMDKKEFEKMKQEKSGN